MSLKLPSATLALPFALAACAGAQSRPTVDARDAQLAELAGKLQAQSAVVSDQQRRIEELEMRLATVSSRVASAEKAAAAAAAAAKESHASNPVIEFDGRADKPGAKLADDPRGKLQTVRLKAPQGEEPKGRRLRRNPVDRAPRLPTITNLKEPEQRDLADLAQAPEPRASRRDASLADQRFADAVQKLNDGDRKQAQQDLLTFAARNPEHAAADNAIYLAGLAEAQSGDCAGALPLFGRVQVEYPAGDAVPPARLEAARCLLKMGRTGEARDALDALAKDHPDAPEASQARSLLNGLESTPEAR